MLSNTIELKIPDLGEESAVDVIEVAVKDGDTIAKEDILATLETEKASMDLPADQAGKVKQVLIKAGDKVKTGDTILVLEISQDTKKEDPKPSSSAKAAPSLQQESVIELKVPDLGEESAVDVIDVAVKDGDTIAKEDILATLETEKASMDLPADSAGTVKQVLIKVGDKVKAGDSILLLKVSQNAQQDEPKPSGSPKASAQKPEPDHIDQVPEPVAAKSAAKPAIAPLHSIFRNASAHAGPATRRLATELGVDLTKVNGSGRKGRIVISDVKAFVKQQMQSPGQGSGLNVAAMPEIDFSQFGEIETKALSKIKRLTGVNLHRNWVNIPHVTQFDQADITELEKFRKENKQAANDLGIKLTPLSFIVKAVMSALQAFPQFNASLAANGEDIIFKKYFNIGVAVDTPDGLVVPVIKDVNNKGLFDLAREIIELSNMAQNKKLKNTHLSGSCFSISSLGSIGGTAFTPIINAPDLAILGISKAEIKPVYKDGDFVPRTMLPLSLSYDHRVIDGVEAVKFLNHIITNLQDIRKLLF